MNTPEWILKKAAKIPHLPYNRLYRTNQKLHAAMEEGNRERVDVMTRRKAKLIKQMMNSDDYRHTIRTDKLNPDLLSIYIYSKSKVRLCRYHLPKEIAIELEII